MQRLLLSIGFGLVVSTLLPIATVVSTSSYTMSNFDQAGAMRRLVRLNTSISLFPSLVAGISTAIGCWVTSGMYAQSLERRGVLRKLSDSEIQLLLTAGEIDIEKRIEILQVADKANDKKLDILPLIKDSIEETPV